MASLHKLIVWQVDYTPVTLLIKTTQKKIGRKIVLSGRRPCHHFGRMEVAATALKPACDVNGLSQGPRK